VLQVRGRVTQGASECLVMLDEDMDSEAGMEYLIDGQDSLQADDSAGVGDNYDESEAVGVIEDPALVDEAGFDFGEAPSMSDDDDRDDDAL